MFFLDYIYNDLTEMERKIADKIYKEGKDYKGVGTDLGVCKSSFYRYRHKIIKKVKAIDRKSIGGGKE